MIQQQAGEGSIPLQSANVRLRDDAAEQGRVTAEAVGIDFGFSVHVRAMLDQPARDLDLVEIDAHVQQRRAAKGVPCSARE